MNNIMKTKEEIIKEKTLEFINEYKQALKEYNNK